MLAFGTLIARTNARTDLPPAWPDSLDWMQGIDSSCLSKLMQVGYLAVFRGRLVEAQSIFQGWLCFALPARFRCWDWPSWNSVLAISKRPVDGWMRLKFSSLTRLTR